LDDLQDLYALVSQPEVMQYLPDNVMTLEMTEGLLRWVVDCYDMNTPEKIEKFTLAVEHRDDGKVIGSFGLGPLDFDPSEMEIYFALSKDYWGKGYATEAAKAVLHYGFDAIGLDRIVAVVMPENVASKRVVDKLGMIYRRRVTDLQDEFRDYEGDLYYSLTKEEYDAMTAD
jgi:ribosomal-protein-alanine N-acetyltransferase